MIRRDLDNVQDDTQITATFHLLVDTGAPNAYGMPAKVDTPITTTVIMSPVRHDEQFIGEGVHQVADYRCIVHRLEAGGTDYIESEWFSETNVRNVQVEVGDKRYRVLEKKGHQNWRDKCPYHVLMLAEIHNRGP